MLSPIYASVFQVASLCVPMLVNNISLTS